MYLERITLPSMSLEEELLYSTDSPIRTMKGLIKCHSGNLYPFDLFPERSKRMEGPSPEFTNDVTILIRQEKHP